MKKIFEFIKKEKTILILIFIYMFFIYFYYFNDIVSIDTETFMTNKNELLNSWVGINRFSLVFLKSIINVPFNILTTRIITFALFYILIIFYAYLFSKWINNKNKITIFINSILLGSSLIFAEQFGFTLQSAEIAFGLLLFGINFMLLDKGFKNKNKACLIVSIIITLFCFGLYQAFVILYISISIFYIITHDNKYIKEFLILFIISFSLYYLFGFIFKNYVYDVSSSYLSNSFNWKNDSIIKNILRIGYFGVTTLLGLNKYHSVAYLLFFIIGFVTLIKNNKIKELLLYLLLSLTPFLLIIATASNTAYRAQFSYPFVLLFMFLYLIKNIKTKSIIYIIIILCIMKQTVMTPCLLYIDYKRFNIDLELSNYINEIIKNENDCIIFVGKYNNRIKFKGETLGNSFAAWDYETEFGVNNRMYGFLKTQNINYRMPSIKEYELAKKINMENLNNQSVIYYEDYIIINLDSLIISNN